MDGSAHTLEFDYQGPQHKAGKKWPRSGAIIHSPDRIEDLNLPPSSGMRAMPLCAPAVSTRHS